MSENPASSKDSTWPNPHWKPGDPVRPSPLGEQFTSFEFGALDVKTIYSLMIGAVVPRPIALVATRSASGAGNLAPFSYFTAVSSQPPCIAISITPKSATEPKDTLRNIQETREFTVNLVSEWMIEAVNYTSASYPFGLDELSQVGLTPLASESVKPARVKESPVQLECVLEQLVPIGQGHGSTTLVIGRIVKAHIATQALNGHAIDPQAVRPISRLGGNFYGCTDRFFELPRPRIES